MREAVRIVNENQERISHTLRAVGSADGYFTTSKGRRHRFHLDATLFFLAPTYLRFDLKKFGDRQMLFGSNDRWYWSYTREDDAYSCGRHGVEDGSVDGLPALPRQIIDALGLAGIEADGNVSGPVQRVVDDFQQLLFVTRADDGTPALEREIWLDRCAPRLIRKVVFRDSDGVVEMESELSDYSPVAPGGPRLPMVIIARWPAQEMQLRFRVARWTFVEQVKPDGPQFATPRDCDDG